MEAAARTAGQNHTEPGHRPMIRHGMIRPSVAGAQPPATDPHASMEFIQADRTAPSPTPCRQRHEITQQSGLSASIVALSGHRHAIADISRKLKSP
jgi:hypothetical protein